MSKNGIDISHELFEHGRDIKEQMVSVALDYDHALQSRDPLN
jgi:actin-related protein